jgi:hypothetical protein
MTVTTDSRRVREAHDRIRAALGLQPAETPQKKIGKNLAALAVGGNRTWQLFLVFLVLKLTEVIDWSWWFVTMPLYGLVVGAVAITLGLLLIGLLFTALGALIGLCLKPFRRKPTIGMKMPGNAR